MHQSLVLIEEAIAIAEQEEQALLDSDFDQVEALCEKRSSLEIKAWENREGCEESELLILYNQLYSIQLRLEKIANEGLENVKDLLATSKKQTQYFSSRKSQPYAGNEIRLFSKNL